MRPVLWIKLIFIVLFSSIFFSSYATEKSIYKIGVLAYKGKDQAIQHWRAHEEYLNRVLFPITFTIIPLSYKGEEMTNAVLNKEIDFVITNPGQYTELALQGHLTNLATRRVKGPLGTLDVFGGTAITLKDQDAPSSYKQIVGKTIAIPSKHSLGGWQVHLREALQQDNDLLGKNKIVELKNHIKVVDAVLSGEADVGFIRSDLLENLASRGRQDIQKLKIINEQQYPNYPYALSTQLYPEWPFAMLLETPKYIAARVLKALLNMSPSEKAAKHAGIDGWTIPGNYSEVNELFREVGLGPYQLKDLTFIDVLHTYDRELLLVVLAVFGLITGLSNRAQKAEFALSKETLSRQHAENNINAQAQLLDKVAHEFRSPVHAILNFAKISRKKVKDDTIKEYLDNIISSSSRAFKLTNSLLDLSKLEAKMMEINRSRNDISETVMIAVNELMIQAEKKSISISCKCEKETYAEYDSDLMTQVFINLISNAIKFTHDNGAIDIVVSRKENTLNISISDTGLGIPQDQIESVFDKFIRSSETKSYMGTGLGLPICREIVELHDGKIWAQSPPEGKASGSVFHIVMPQ